MFHRRGWRAERGTGHGPSSMDTLGMAHSSWDGTGSTQLPPPAPNPISCSILAQPFSSPVLLWDLLLRGTAKLCWPKLTVNTRLQGCDVAKPPCSGILGSTSVEENGTLGGFPAGNLLNSLWTDQLGVSLKPKITEPLCKALNTFLSFCFL